MLLILRMIMNANAKMMPMSIAAGAISMMKFTMVSDVFIVSPH